MLSEKHAIPAIKLLSLALAAALSFFVFSTALPKSDFVRDSLESVENSGNTVMEFSAATLAASVAISALPDDFATPLADSLADMNVYFIAILTVIFLEKLLIRYGIKVAFTILIPLSCLAAMLFVATKKDLLRGLAVRLCILGLAAALVVPCSTHITDAVASDLTDYVNETIEETESGAGKLGEAMEGGTEDRTIFEKLSDLFQTAIRDISDLMLHFQNTVRKCMNSIAILILTNCLMPLFTVFIFKWLLGELFHISFPRPPMRVRRDTGAEAEPAPELAAVGKEMP